MVPNARTKIHAPLSCKLFLMSASGEQPQKLKLFLWTGCVLLGLFQIWLGRNSMNPDGISYLDMGDAYFRGDWKMAINAYWSPLYSWIVALGLHIFHPSVRSEFQVVHLMQFIIYLFTIFSFHFFLLQVILWNHNQLSSKFLVITDWAWLILGYSLFLWSSLKLITLSNETPDMIAVAFLYLATGMMLRILNDGTNVFNFILLGVSLALGYFARAPFFPLTFVFLIITFSAIKNIRKALPLTLAALLSFLCLSGPFILALSNSKGQFTVGESGKLNYAWKVNGVVPQYIHWQGTPGFGKPEHPTRRIFENPAIYEFGTPVGGTYPPWYDPSYWYEGVVTHFNFRQQLARIITSLRFCVDTFFHTEDKSSINPVFSADAFAVGYVILLLVSGRKRFALKDLFENYPLILTSLFGLGMYALVSVHPRYVAGYLVLLWLGLFSSIKLADTQDNKRTTEAVTIAVALVVLLSSSVTLIFDTYGEFRNSLSGKNSFIAADVAEGLQKIGIQSGSKVANIGYSFEAYWARLARAKIVSEITSDDEINFWKADTNVRNQVYEKFAETGALIVVTKNPPKWANLDGWSELDHTNYFVHNLRNTSDESMHH